MARYYLVADHVGWHRPVHRRDMSLDCVRAASDGDVMEWRSGLNSTDHAGLVQQWMSRAGDFTLSDEWIPSEWLLRVWDSPAMAAVESGKAAPRARLFEIEAEPVLLARSIPVVVPELGLAGVNRFQVVREVPNWWLLGPCGREVSAVLAQFHSLAVETPAMSAAGDRDTELAGLRMRALDVVDAARRVGAYTIVRAAVGEGPHRFGEHHQLALGAAMGFALKDVWPDAPLLYGPWVRRHGLPDLGVMDHGDLPYPVEWVL